MSYFRQATWKLIAELLDQSEAWFPGTKAENRKLFSQEGRKLDTNLCQSVFANRPVLVTWTTSNNGRGWSLCILPIDVAQPDERPADLLVLGYPAH